MEGLFGADFEIDIGKTKADIKKLIKKLTPDTEKSTKTDTEKLLASKKLTIQERLAVISEKVIKTLGSQRTNTVVIRSLSDFSAYVTKALQVGRIAIDTETNNTTDAATCKLMGLCLYVPGEKQAYIPINHVNYETGELLPNQLTTQDCKVQLQRILDNKVFTVMHNGKFDYEVILHTCGIAVPPNWDTLVAARLIDENLYSDKKTSLKWLYINLIDPRQAKYDIEGLFENVPYAYVDPEIFALYAATDSMMTDKLYLWEAPYFDGPENAKLKSLLENIEMPIVEVTAKMEMRGVCVDQEFGQRLKEKYNNELKEIDIKINNELASIKDLIAAWRLSPAANEKTKSYVPKKTKMTGEKIEQTYTEFDENGDRFKWSKPKTEQLKDPINLNATPQLAILFYDILCVSEVYKNHDRKTGKDDLKAIAEAVKNYVNVEQQEALTKAMEMDAIDADPDQVQVSDATNDIDDEYDLTQLTPDKARVAASLCSALLERRGLTKLISTYIDTIPDLAQHWPDGRIRFRLNSTGTDTGRYSSGGKWKFLDEENKKVDLPGINIQNIPSHNPEIRMLFKARVDKSDVEVDEESEITIPEITEIETNAGFKFGKDLTTADKLITEDGEVLDIKNIIYNQKHKEYIIQI